MQTALEMAFAHVRQAGASRIHRMQLRVGVLSGVVPEALEMAFAAATRDTPADGAELVVEQVPVICRCAQCDYEFCPTDFVFLCSNCGALNSCVQQGRELELASLEVS
ncbi:MAG TPA: hydrogenase maturation nickel metallochaperone HypA [Lacipirellulaceae bacterium]